MLVNLPSTRPNRSVGFSLLELLVTVAIVAILAAFAAPSLRTFIVRNTFSNIGNEFSGSILRARNEAVSKNICVTMCVSDTVDNAKPFCKQAGQDWQVGWIVFMNPSCDLNYGKDATSNAVTAPNMILVRRAGNPDYTLMAQSSTRRIQFNARGNSGSGALESFNLDYVNTPLALQYAFNICLDKMGRTRSIPSTSTCNNF